MQKKLCKKQARREAKCTPLQRAKRALGMLQRLRTARQQRVLSASQPTSWKTRPWRTPTITPGLPGTTTSPWRSKELPTERRMKRRRTGNWREEGRTWRTCCSPRWSRIEWSCWSLRCGPEPSKPCWPCTNSARRTRRVA
ncbi:uncharacterized protein [Littorina saxatilis]|uniref:uncharacterized protein n=1 Tax=Littorina saxatilis TaxID=31220 RepID=UPI0038B63C1D